MLYLKDKVKMGWQDLTSILHDAAKGINRLHMKVPPVLHRDLKGLNILIRKNGSACVADFGISKEDQDRAMTIGVGTLPWMAPEVLEGKRYSTKADVYSFGMIMYEVLARTVPFRELSRVEEIKQAIISGGRPEILGEVARACPEGYIDLMEKCWSPKVERRPIFTEILQKMSTIQKKLGSSESTMFPYVKPSSSGLASGALLTIPSGLAASSGSPSPSVPSSSSAPVHEGKKSMKSWDTAEVLNWMKSVDLVEFCEVFSQKRVRGTTLFRLDEKRLEEFGISAPYDRERILAELDMLKESL